MKHSLLHLALAVSLCAAAGRVSAQATDAAKVSLHLYRPSAIAARAYRPHIFLNSEPLLDLRNGGVWIGQLAPGQPSVALRDSLAVQRRGIDNIAKFLDQCPDRDPAFSQIQLDFEIRRDGKPTPVPFCSEPVSAMTTKEYTDVLIILQGLRVAYYMDRGQSGHLPWTAGTLYDWLKTRINGINIVTGSFGGGSCCVVLGSKRFMTMGEQDDPNREFDRTWRGIAGNIAFYAHEARHVDGYPHVSCCGIPFGCDQRFDSSNPSAYGVQWVLAKLWLDGTINVGYGCLAPLDVSQTAWWFALDLNEQFRQRFCADLPPSVTVPPAPFGACTTGAQKRRAVRR